MIQRLLFLAIALAASGAASAAEVVGTITILEGQALIVRGSGRLHAAEGVRIASGDIVETAAGTLVQLELADRSVAQIGPATRVMVDPPAARATAERSMYLLEGWLKWVGAKPDAKAADATAIEPAFTLRSPNFEISPSPATVVLRSGGDTLELFVERGEMRVAERQSGSEATTAVALAAGNFYQRKAPARGSVAGVAPQAFVAAMPRAYRDALPQRLEQFRNRVVQPKEAPAFAYADVQPWLQAEAPLRKPFVQRWRAKAKEPAFRAALIANVRAHPEWDPVLFPEKYKPKPPPPKPTFAPFAAAAPAPAKAAATNTTPTPSSAPAPTPAPVADAASAPAQ